MATEEKEYEVKLRMIIKGELRKCSPSVTPRFCEMIRSKEGYLKAESMIIDYAIRNQVSVSAAIGQLEMELE
jgi:hypothetical protein